jgi:hypothetical protein
MYGYHYSSFTVLNIQKDRRKAPSKLRTPQQSPATTGKSIPQHLPIKLHFNFQFDPRLYNIIHPLHSRLLEKQAAISPVQGK